MSKKPSDEASKEFSKAAPKTSSEQWGKSLRKIAKADWRAMDGIRPHGPQDTMYEYQKKEMEKSAKKCNKDAFNYYAYEFEKGF